ncbi:hypothetical protein [Prosthecobacter sp.]|uniref:hypothetical protein n=1 Tax=Prosthecobacter sp. TaxID=1965333 RepID=UPI0024872A6C|nr:hypothetical protein [Prosthecobacter sp.]MDI1314413.1 hypothetical protein [Prosthecobacter sp.]
MKTPSPAISFVLQRWQTWLLQAAALVVLASCTLPADNGGLPGAATPNVQGIYQGSYTYGGAYQKLAGQVITFEISLRQARGSNKIKGVTKENYTGFGTLKDGFVWADITGTCEGEDGLIHLQFTKTYRNSKELPVTYRGSLPPGSGLLAGTWYFPSKPSDSGMFQINNIQVQ